MNACLKLLPTNVASEATSGNPEDVYWHNLYVRCGGPQRVELSEFMADPWKWLRAYGMGEFGWDSLPLLPRQAEIAARLKEVEFD